MGAAKRATTASYQDSILEEPVVLSLKAGLTVICGDTDSEDWWMADVNQVDIDRGGWDPKVPTLYEVAKVDSGMILWVYADLVTNILPDN